MNNAYADALDSMLFSRLGENYFAQELRNACREESTRDMADLIAAEVVADHANSRRRRDWIDAVVDDGIENLLRDLLDDLKAGIDPTETLRRRVRNWALDEARYEIERGEA